MSLAASLYRMDLSRWRSSLLTLTGGIALSACSAEETNLREVRLRSIVERDPCFGAPHFLTRSLLLDPTVQASRTPDAQRAFFLGRRQSLEHVALLNARRVFERVDTAQLTELDVFLRSMTGRAFCAAQFVTGCQPLLGEDFASKVIEYCSDREQVGLRAAAEVRQAEHALATGEGSVSPPQLAYRMAAAEMTPLDADALQAFAQTNAGRTWTAARVASRTTVIGLRGLLLHHAKEAGVLRSDPGPEELEDLVLPAETTGR